MSLTSSLPGLRTGVAARPGYVGPISGTGPVWALRVPNPADRRAKLVLPTDRGREVIEIAQSLVPELEHWVGTLIGAERANALRQDLEVIQRSAARGRTG